MAALTSIKEKKSDTDREKALIFLKFKVPKNALDGDTGSFFQKLIRLLNDIVLQSVCYFGTFKILNIQNLSHKAVLSV